MEIIRSTLEDNGIKNKNDIISLVRSKSTRDHLNPPSSIGLSSYR